MILDYELCVNFTPSSQLDFRCELLYYTFPGSIPSPNRHPCTNACNQAARLKLGNQSPACAVFLVDAVDCQLLIRSKPSVALHFIHSVKDRDPGGSRIFPDRYYPVKG
jgi:hypothetical protein